MHKRMGDEVHQEKDIPLAVIHKVVNSLETEYDSRRSDGERETIVNIAVFVLASFLEALRGEKTLKIVLGETRNYFQENQCNLQHKHVVLPLRGRFKGEDGEGFHFVAVSSKTDSGLRIGPWVQRGLDIKDKRGRMNGFFFANKQNRQMKLKYLESCILDRIARVQTNYSELISSSINVHDEYGLLRSFRRGSNSEALNRGVSEAVIDRNNRWRKEERAGARKAKFRMRDHYTDVFVSKSISTIFSGFISSVKRFSQFRFTYLQG